MIYAKGETTTNLDELANRRTLIGYELSTRPHRSCYAYRITAQSDRIC